MRAHARGAAGGFEFVTSKSAEAQQPAAARAACAPAAMAARAWKEAAAEPDQNLRSLPRCAMFLRDGGYRPCWRSMMAMMMASMPITMPIIMPIIMHIIIIMPIIIMSITIMPIVIMPINYAYYHYAYY